MCKVVYTEQSTKDIENQRAAGLSSKAKGLIEIIGNDPFANPPPYEALVGNLDGFCSRGINIKHRLVYQVYGDKVETGDTKHEGTVKIVSMWTLWENIR